MKKINILFLLLLVSIVNYGQNDVLKDLQGLSYNGNQFYELSGVNIEVVTQKITFNQKGIKKIKKVCNIKNIQKEYTDSTLRIDNLVIESIHKEKKNTANSICYIFQKNDKETTFILFRSGLPLSSSFVNAFVRNYFDDKLSQYSGILPETTTGTVDSINFVGRKIPLGGNCRFMYVNNIQCSGYGQMSWSIFDSRESSDLFEKLMIENGDSNPGAGLVTASDVDITFEGIKTKAKRRIYKTKFMESLLMGGSRLLCVYYVTQEIRGRYVNVVLSYYMNNKDDFELAPLLKEVMSLD